MALGVNTFNTPCAQHKTALRRKGLDFPIAILVKRRHVYVAENCNDIPDFWASMIQNGVLVKQGLARMILSTNGKYGEI
jgi:hypothetical protein